jgi:surfeit locus 1 family protein
MRVRTALSLAIPLACAVLFVRLGVWQLSRHGERAALNAGLDARLVAPPVPLGNLASDTTDARWIRVTVSGRFRYDLEQVQAGRASEGSPGVHLITPLERDGNDTLVIVTRGWVYSPDASSADLNRWREADSVSLTGYLVPIVPEGLPAPADPQAPMRSLNLQALRTRFSVPIAPVQIVMTSDSLARADSVPKRLPPPRVDAGPHRSYAAQWFAFALIAIIGGGVLFRRTVVTDRSKG